MFPLNVFNFFSNSIVKFISNLPYYALYFLIIFLPTLGYLDSIFRMYENKTYIYCNMYTSFILIISYFLKVVYWFHEHYEFYILLQTMVVFLVQIALLFYYFEYNEKCIPFRQYMRHFKNNSLYRYHNFLMIKNPLFAKSFLDFIISLTLLCVIILLCILTFSYIFGKKVIFSVTVYFSTIIETTVSLPVFITVCVNGDTNSVSKLLINQYIIGDIARIFMFMMVKTDRVFIFGSILQFSIDLINCVVYYMKNRAEKSSKRYKMYNDRENLL